MRVIQITPIVGSGAVGRIVDQIYKGLIKNGDECKVVCGKIGNTFIPKKDIILTEKEYKKYLYALYARIFDRDGFGGISDTKRIVKTIEEYQPDIIQMHGNYGYYINVRALYKCIKKNNYPVVNTLHSCWDFTGHCCYFTDANCSRWKTGCYDCPEKRSYPTSWVLDNSKKNYIEKKKLFTGIKKETIVVPSDWLAKKVQYSFLNVYPIKVIKNGIDLKAFENKDGNLDKYGIDRKKIIILGVAGQWTKRKGLLDFIELSKMVDGKYQIVIVGVTRKQKEEFPSNIIGITRTENIDELVTLYSISSVLFNPTYEDNYPTINLESIACNTPVITYKTGGSPESVIKYNAGKIINKKDYTALLYYAKKYHDEKWKLSKSLRNDLSEKRMVSEYIKLYNWIKDKGCEMDSCL